MEDLEYLFAAYTLIWLVISGYLFSLSRKERKLRQDIHYLKEDREEKGK